VNITLKFTFIKSFHSIGMFVLNGSSIGCIGLCKI